MANRFGIMAGGIVAGRGPNGFVAAPRQERADRRGKGWRNAVFFHPAMTCYLLFLWTCWGGVEQAPARCWTNVASNATASVSDNLASEVERERELVDPAVFRLMEAPVENSPGKPRQSLSSGTNKPYIAVLHKSAFPKWEHYADERVEFDYPDDPDLVLEVIDRKSRKPVPIDGGPMRTASYNAEVVYRIRASGKTWAVLVWSEDEWLDDGICLCGAVELRTYAVHEGEFYAFSFMGDGKIKQVQCLGERSRLVLFESTHLPIAQNTYVRIAQSLRVKKPIQRTAEELQLETRKRYGFAGRLGWLRVGMPVNEIEALLGTPKSRRSAELVYEEADDQWRTIWHLPIKSKRLQPLPNNFLEGREVPPRAGTLRWFSEKLEKIKDLDEKIPRKTPRRGWQRSFFDGFVREAPRSSSEDWDLWCQYAHAMYDKGFMDSRIVPVVKARFLEPIRQHYARWILDDYNDEASQPLFKQRLNLCLQAAERALAVGKNDQVVRCSSFSAWNDVHNLLAGIPRQERNLLLPKILEHPHPDVRSDAYFYVDLMPEPQRTTYVRAGLNDPTSQVRAWSAYAIGKGAGSIEDLPKLKQLLATDKDHYVQEWVSKAIVRLKEATLKP